MSLDLTHKQYNYQTFLLSWPSWPIQSISLYVRLWLCPHLFTPFKSLFAPTSQGPRSNFWIFEILGESNEKKMMY